MFGIVVFYCFHHTSSCLLGFKFYILNVAFQLYQKITISQDGSCLDYQLTIIQDSRCLDYKFTIFKTVVVLTTSSQFCKTVAVLTKSSLFYETVAVVLFSVMIPGWHTQASNSLHAQSSKKTFRYQ